MISLMKKMTKLRKTASQKAKSIIDSSSAFLLHYSDKLEYWVSRGSTGNLYSIVYNKHLDSYNCSCKNIRLIDCSHIIAIKEMKK